MEQTKKLSIKEAQSEMEKALREHIQADKEQKRLMAIANEAQNAAHIATQAVAEAQSKFKQAEAVWTAAITDSEANVSAAS